MVKQMLDLTKQNKCSVLYDGSFTVQLTASQEPFERETEWELLY